LIWHPITIAIVWKNGTSVGGNAGIRWALILLVIDIIPIAVTTRRVVFTWILGFSLRSEKLTDDIVIFNFDSRVIHLCRAARVLGRACTCVAIILVIWHTVVILVIGHWASAII